MQFEWQQGRNLSKITNKNGDSIVYTYDGNGIRTSKNVNGNIVQYLLEGNKVIYENRDEYDIYYIYDESGELTGFEYKDNIYIYKKSLTGDIIGIYDINGKEVVTYVYDVWGNVINVDGNANIASVNPYRYKGYYYDEESGLYYLNSRYYDASIGRFINADKYIDTKTGIFSDNMYAYCENSPLIRENSTGEVWNSIIYVDCNAEETGMLLNAYSSYKPKYNSLYAWAPDIMINYNCYGFAVNYYTSRINPGYFSGKRYALNLQTIVDNAIADLKKRGYKNVKEIAKSEIESSGGTVIAVRIGEEDYHWMRYAKRLGGWYHKPGNTAILKLNAAPYDYSIWYSEYYFGYWGIDKYTYTSAIRYITYYK